MDGPTSSQSLELYRKLHLGDSVGDIFYLPEEEWMRIRSVSISPFHKFLQVKTKNTLTPSCLPARLASIAGGRQILLAVGGEGEQGGRCIEDHFAHLCELMKNFHVNGLWHEASRILTKTSTQYGALNSQWPDNHSARSP